MSNQSLNRVTMSGNLVRDVELRYTNSGTAVAEVAVAINERAKQGNDWKDVVHFVDVALWGKTAEIAGEYLSKGSYVIIEGRLKMDSWEQDGQKRSKLKVTADRLIMTPRGGGSDAPNEAVKPRTQSRPSSRPVTSPPFDEDLPY